MINIYLPHVRKTKYQYRLRTKDSVHLRHDRCNAESKTHSTLSNHINTLQRLVFFLSLDSLPARTVDKGNRRFGTLSDRQVQASATFVCSSKTSSVGVIDLSKRGIEVSVKTGAGPTVQTLQAHKTFLSASGTSSVGVMDLSRTALCVSVLQMPG